MIDGDEKLHRRYRELPREEPPEALDAAILAKARRPVARPGSPKRWMMPVSIAAVLVLSVGLVLRMQQEEPGIETAAPPSEYPVGPGAEPPEPADTPAQPAKPPEAPALRAERAPVSESRAKPASPKEKRPAAPKPKIMQAPETRPGPSPFPGGEPPATILQAPAPTRQVPGATLSAPRSAAPAESPAEAPAPVPRTKREMFRAEDSAAASAPAGPERELERIARLRQEGRHEEADLALERFRRDHPRYRIPAAVWERVRPR